jgi:hypothetical protein
VPSLADLEKINLKTLRNQIVVLEFERDAAFQEIEDLRKKLHLTKKDNKHLREVLINFGKEMMRKGSYEEDVFT